MPRRILMGFVVSDKNQKTIIVKVKRSFMHPKLKKIVNISKKYPTHVEGVKPALGQDVKIMEVAPVSKTKKWILLRI